jgi:hypothetical protein
LSASERYGDVTAILYLVPFLASGIYGVYLWAQAGFSYLLPKSVYLTVTRDPYIFLIGSLSILVGVVLDMRGSPGPDRRAKLGSLGGTLQSVALASLVLALIAAFYSNGFTNVGGAADDFIVGRYGLVFPAVLVLLSYLVTARFDFGSLRKPKVLGVIALLLVPASVYEVGKHDLAVGLAIALVLLVLGLASFVLPARKKAQVKEE